jgi:GH25 family lysozyme M1 (1,4-beta-N-acetylmuramidase)
MTHTLRAAWLFTSIGMLGTACTIGEPSDDSAAGAGLGDLDHSGTPQDGVDSLAARVCANGATTMGVDVSFYQDDIDWNKAKSAGVQFAFVRLSDGTRHPDSKFQRNWQGTKAVGIIRGAYQFFRPAQDVDAQANMMIKAIGTYQPGDLPPVIDVEASGDLSPSTVAAKVRAWTKKVEAALGVKPIVYTGKYFWRDEVGGPSDFDDNALWIAQYTSQCPDIPSPWSKWTFWQYTDKGPVSGIGSQVDINRFNGSIDELRAFANGVASAPMPAVTFDWKRQADASYQFVAQAPANVSKVEFRVGDYLIGAATRNAAGEFKASYSFSVATADRTIEARGLSSAGATVALGNGMIDSVASTALFIRQTGASAYEIGLERAEPGVAWVSVTADGTALVDSVSNNVKSTRGAVAHAFTQRAVRNIELTSYNSNGSVRGVMRRTLAIR